MIHLLFFIPIIFLILGLTYLVIQWPSGGLYATFSHHAASTKEATRYYIALFLVCLPPVVAWFALWLMPHLRLPVTAFITIAIAVIVQIVAASIPERPPHVTLHRGVTAVSLGAILATLITIWYETRSNMIITALMILALIIIYAGIMGDRAKYPLLLQTGFYSIFFITLGSFIFQ